jgi:hypothetical protein
VSVTVQLPDLAVAQPALDPPPVECPPRSCDAAAAPTRSSSRPTRTRSARRHDAFAELVERSGKAMVANRRARTQGNRLAKDIGLETCGTALY